MKMKLFPASRPYRYQVELSIVCEWPRSSDARAGGRLIVAQSQLHFGIISPTFTHHIHIHDGCLSYTFPSLLLVFSSLSTHHPVTSLPLSTGEREHVDHQ